MRGGVTVISHRIKRWCRDYYRTTYDMQYVYQKKSTNKFLKHSNKKNIF